MSDFDFYTWREVKVVDGKTRHLIPQSDPHEHEYPFDFIFDSPEEAWDVLCDFGFQREGWVLVHYRGTHVTIIPGVDNDDVSFNE